MDETILKIIEVVEKTAPELWRIGVQQAVSKGIWELILSGLFLIISIISIYYIVRYVKKLIEIENHNAKFSRYSAEIIDSDLVEGLTACFIVATAISVPAMVVLFRSGAMMLANPEYYAIKLLLDLI